LKAEKYYLPGIIFHQDLQKFKIILSVDLMLGKEMYCKE